ncbi:hypothetical protein DITRI_Ditri20bG0009400 [Diplodiscus trichospermus]
MAESRFSRVAVLRTTDWLEIRGSISAQKLTPNTIYDAYIKMKISDQAYGIELVPSEATVEMGNQVCSSSIFLQYQQKSQKQMEMWELSEEKQGMVSVKGNMGGWRLRWGSSLMEKMMRR